MQRSPLPPERIFRSQRLAHSANSRLSISLESHPQHVQHELLISNLTRIFGEFDDTMLSLIEPKLEWLEVGGGETLFRQGDVGNTLYFVISGRLKAIITDTDGRSKVIGEIVRGETVGEMAVFTASPRSATVVAIRDSLLVRLSKETFEEVIAAYPGVAMNVTRLIITRLQTAQNPRKPIKKPVNICLLAVHDTVQLMDFVQQLQPLLAKRGGICVASSESVDSALGHPGVAQADKSDSAAYRELTRWLDDQESQHEFLVYVADRSMTEWTRRCLRQADEILLLADTDQSPETSALESQYQAWKPQMGAAEVLVLIHPTETLTPHGTANWLQHRPGVKAHYHIRQGLARDMARISRILSGTAIGLVLAGGGAKGFAHIGVLKALEAADIPIDFVGGTSVGAVVAAAISYDKPAESVALTMKKGALYNPTKDYNWLPLVSLIRGLRMERMIKNSVREFLGRDEPDIEDSWRTLFLVSSNYSQAREVIHTRGPLVKYLQASTAIPGVFPPVIDGDDLLVDGGTFNNFPADVMSRLGVGKVIGIDLVIDKPRKLNFTEMPRPIALLRDRFRPKRLKKYRVPSLVSIMINSMLLYSAARRNETKQFIDLYFNPDVSKYGLLDWRSFDKIAEKGYAHGREVLAQLSPEELGAFTS